MRSSRLFKFLDRLIGVPLVAFFGLFTRPKAAKALGPGSSLLIVKFSAMGDTLLMLPLLKAARQALGPQGRMEMIATPVNQAVAKANPWLDEVHVISPGRMLLMPWKVPGLLWRLRRRRFDAVIDFDQWLRVSALLSFGSGAAFRLGFKTPGQSKHALFHAAVDYRREVHEFSHFRELLELVGIPASAVEPYEGFLAREGIFGAEAAPRRDGHLVLLHPGAGGRKGWQREWPVERFAALGRALRERLGARVGLSGAGAYEAALCSEIEAGMGQADESCVNTGLKQLVATLGRAGLLICGNTGVMHLAVGLGTPVLALHGPNPHLKWGPLGEKARVLLAKTACSPCLSLGFEFGCPQRPCMESISVEETQEAAEAMLA